MKIKGSDLVLIVLFSLLVGFLGGIYASSLYQPQETKVSVRLVDGERVVTTYLPAVDIRGNGVVGLLKTTVKPGSGGVSVDIDVLSYLDTQQSAKIAAEIARNYTNIDTNNLDINYAIEVNATAIEGTSAGAAMTVSVITALQNKTLNNSVMITGIIEEDGTIGQVGAIVAKAKAAKEVGAMLFLVPEGQASAIELKRNKECRKLGFIDYCEVTYKQQKISVEEIAGIAVVEVRNIDDVVKYMVI